MSKVRIRTCGYEFMARLETEKAPATCAAFLKLLPYENKIIHVRWSGEGVWIPLGNLDLGVPYENHTRYPSKGEFLFYPGGISETEMILAYGSVSFASKVGGLSGNHFLTIESGLENLYAMGRKTLWEGAQDIFFSLAD